MAASKKGTTPTTTDTEAPEAPVSTRAEANARARATAKVNATSGIDFGAAADEDDFAVANARQSAITVKLEELLKGVKAGAGQVGKFYRLAEYTGTSGARTTINNLKKKPERLPGGADFALKVKIVRNGTEKHSELWASVESIDADA
jgi:hypothetical protein